MEKSLSDGNVEQEEAFLLLIKVLEENRRHERMIEVLSEQGAKLVNLEWERILMIAQVYQKLENHSEAVKLYLQLLREHNSDDWSFYVSLFEECKFLPEEDLPQFERVFTEFRDRSPALRGPKLAIMEMHKRYSSPEELDGKLKPLFLSYLASTGNKSVCFRDLKSYVRLCGKAAGFEDELRSACPDWSRADVIAYDATVQKLLRYGGVYSDYSNEWLVRLIESNAKVIEEAVEINRGLGLHPSDRGVADDHVLLNVFNLVEMLVRTGDSEYLLQALESLEGAVTRSPQNADLHLFRCLLFAWVGAAVPAFEAYEKLGIRYIQCLTCTHIILDDLFRFGAFEEALNICKSAEDTDVVTVQESSEHIFRSLENGNFSRVKEFLDYEKRVGTSHMLWVSRIERILLDVSKKVSLLEAHEFLLSEKFLRRPPRVVPSNDFSFIANFEYVPPQELGENRSYVKDPRDVLPFIDSTNALFRSVEFKTIVGSAANTWMPYEVQLQWLELKGLLCVLLLPLTKPTDSIKDRGDTEAMVSEFHSLVESVCGENSINKCNWGLVDALVSCQLAYSSFQKTIHANDCHSCEWMIERISVLEKALDAFQASYEGIFDRRDGGLVGLNEPLSVVAVAAVYVFPLIVFFNEFWFRNPPLAKKRKEKAIWRTYRALLALHSKLEASICGMYDLLLTERKRLEDEQPLRPILSLIRASHARSVKDLMIVLHEQSVAVRNMQAAE